MSKKNEFESNVEIKKPQVYCKRCIMDDTVPDFKTTSTGCNFCDAYFDMKAAFVVDGQKGYDKISVIFEKIKEERKDKEFDVIIGVSGGYDSSSVVYYAHKFGLRALLVHADNGYDTKEGTANVAALKKYTGYPVKEISVDMNEFVDLQKAILKSGVINFEAATDLLIRTALYSTAEENNIPYLLQGTNVNSEGLRVVKWGFPNDDERNIRGIYKKFGSFKWPLKTVTLMNYYQYRKYRSKITFISPLNYLEYNPDKMKDLLIKEVPGFQDYGEKHQESIVTNFYQHYMLWKRFGIDKRKVFYANRVCAGIMTRKKALEKLKKITFPKYNEHVKFIAKKMNLSVPELLQLIMEPLITPHNKYGTDRFLRRIAVIRFGGMPYLKKKFKRKSKQET